MQGILFLLIALHGEHGKWLNLFLMIQSYHKLMIVSQCLVPSTCLERWVNKNILYCTCYSMNDAFTWRIKVYKALRPSNKWPQATFPFYGVQFIYLQLFFSHRIPIKQILLLSVHLDSWYLLLLWRAGNQRQVKSSSCV